MEKDIFMKDGQVFDENPGAIFIFCLLYALHMVEEFTRNQTSPFSLLA